MKIVKKENIRIREILGILILFTGMMMFSACTQQRGSSNDEQNTELSAEDYQQSKQEVVKDLQALRQKANDKLDDLQQRSENAADTVKSNISTSMEEIKAQKESVNEMLEKVNTGSKETWKDVKLQAEQLIDDANHKIDQAAEKVQDLFSADNT